MFLIILAVQSSQPSFVPLTESQRMQWAEQVSAEMIDPDDVIWRWPLRNANSPFYCAWANARNSYGGRTGLQQFFTRYRIASDGTVTLEIIDLPTESPTMRTIIRLACDRAGYDTSHPPSP